MGQLLMRLFVASVLLSVVLGTSSAIGADREFGGCTSSGTICAGPSAAISVGEYNLATGKLAGGVIPGVGYGAVVYPERWYAAGMAVYLSMLVGKSQPNQVSPTLMFSFADYLRIGIGVVVTEKDEGQAQKQWRLLFGLGADFGK